MCRTWALIPVKLFPVANHHPVFFEIIGVVVIHVVFVDLCAFSVKLYDILSEMTNLSISTPERRRVISCRADDRYGTRLSQVFTRILNVSVDSIEG